MKDILTEIKNNLWGINSRVDEARNQINDLEHKEEISIHPEQQEEKRIQNNEDSIRDSETSPNIPTSKSQGCQKEKRKSKELEIYLKK